MLEDKKVNKNPTGKKIDLNTYTKDGKSDLVNEKGEVLVKNKVNKEFDYEHATPILDVVHLKQFFRFGRGAFKYTKAVHDVSFKVYKGEVFGLVGESGCGKTTTGRSIIKLYQITSGDVWFKDVRIAAGTRWNEKEIKYTRIRLNKKLSQLKKDCKKDFSFIKNNEIFNNKNINYTASCRDFLSVELIDKLSDLFKNENILTAKNITEAYGDMISTLQKDDKEDKVLTKKKELAEEIKALKRNKIFIGKNIDSLVCLKDNLTNTLLDNLESNEEIINEDLIVKVYEKLIKEAVDFAENIIKTQRDKIKKAKDDNDNCNKKFAKSQVNIVNEKFKDIIEKKKAEIPFDDADKLVYQEYIDELKKAKKAKITTSMQMIFQDPIASLNPRMTVREIIAEGLRIHGLRDEEEISSRVSQMLELVGLLPEHMNRYPHEFSGGQRQRIGIARALIMNPELIIADEPVSALDVSIQAQVINLLNDLREKFGLTILFIAHNLSVVKYFCDRIAVMYFGKLVEVAKSDELFKHPLHPYTKSLLSAVPEPDPNVEKGRKRIIYEPNKVHDYSSDKPSLRELAPGHFVYCNNKEEAEYKELLAKDEK